MADNLHLRTAEALIQNNHALLAAAARARTDARQTTEAALAIGQTARDIRRRAAECRQRWSALRSALSPGER
jgi:hypothetical protein